MAGLLERVNRAAGLAPAEENRFGIDTWVADSLIPSLYSTSGVTTTWDAENHMRQIQTSLPGYTQAVRQSAPAFAAQMFRAATVSQVRFQWRSLPSSSTPRRLFGSRDLALLEKPWPNGTTGLMTGLMEWHAGLAGNAFVYRRSPTRLTVLRPDWVSLVWGSDQEPEQAATALDGELLGYLYWNGGYSSRWDPRSIAPDEMCHWAPLPNPLTPGDGVGESWVTAALRDIQGDSAATEHKLRFFSNAATPNMVVKGLPFKSTKEFDELVDLLDARHRGTGNAYRTLYLTQGADATVVGSNFKDMDLKAIQGSGETRISMIGRVPAALLGISEGLQGSSLNAGNFGMARRIYGDGFLHPQARDLARALQSIITLPRSPVTGRRDEDVELWPDFTDVPLLREDAKDQAEIDSIRMQAIRTAVDGGFEPDTAVAVLAPDWVGKLRHSGNLSVQLQPADPALQNQDGSGSTSEPPTGNGGSGSGSSSSAAPGRARTRTRGPR